MTDTLFPKESDQQSKEQAAQDDHCLVTKTRVNNDRHSGPDENQRSNTDFALPPANTRRWVISRKGQVVKAVEAGILTVEEACNRYDLTPEELTAWRRMVQRHGVRGLRVTQLRQYRSQSIAT